MTIPRYARFATLGGLLCTSAAVLAQERRHVEITVHLVRADNGTVVPNTRIELWTTDQLPGHGVSDSTFHASERTDATGFARFSVSEPAQKYLIYSGDFENCPIPNLAISLSEVTKSGMVIGNTCAEKPAKRPLRLTASPGELLLLTLKPRRLGAW